MELLITGHEEYVHRYVPVYTSKAYGGYLHGRGDVV